MSTHPQCLRMTVDSSQEERLIKIVISCELEVSSIYKQLLIDSRVYDCGWQVIRLRKLIRSLK